VVRRLAAIIRRHDRYHTFAFVSRDSQKSEEKDLVKLLDETPWSLILLDGTGNMWAGPEAIPFILKNLPGGKIAAVSYTIPGTMWLTRQFYLLISRHRRLFASRSLRQPARS
jgi:predicted DCC family thiol-disulfide oxidoreductase YuxK